MNICRLATRFPKYGLSDISLTRNKQTHPAGAAKRVELTRLTHPRSSALIRAHNLPGQSRFKQLAGRSATETENRFAAATTNQQQFMKEKENRKRLSFKVTRTQRGEWSIDGVLSVDGQIICNTVESSIRHLAEGEYFIAMRKCPAEHALICAVDSKKGIVRNCRMCEKIAVCNEKRADRITNAIHHVIAKGIDEGRASSEYLAEALKTERSLPSHPERLEMPFCPHFRVGAGVFGITDSSITVGMDCEVPGMVIHSDITLKNIQKRIVRAVEADIPVTLAITETHR